MINRTFHQIATMLSTDQAGSNDNQIIIQGVSTDSRSLQRGNLFIPLIGDNFDGHAYVQKVFAMGAAASLWQKDHANPPSGLPLIYVDDTLTALQQLARNYLSQLKVRVIGITGSNGKTTTKDLVAGILSTTYKTHKTMGNFNNHIGLPLTLLKLEEDTEMAVLEMGMSERGEIELLSRLAAPEAVIITNVGESHLQQLGSREEIAKAKVEICAGLKPEGIIIYNGDEPLLEQSLIILKQEHNEMGFTLDKGVKTFRFGVESSNDYYPTAMMLDGEGSHFTINMKNSPSYFIPLLGRHNIINTLGAIAVGKYMGTSEKDILKGLRQVQPSGMRVEVVRGYNGITILNDAYNSSPKAMIAAIDLVNELKGYEQKIMVIGDMLELGDKEKEFHIEMGRLLKPEEVNYVFTYGPLAEYIANEAAPLYPAGHVQACTNKQEIVKKIMEMTTSRDLVLIKGSRGMKLEEVVEGLVNGSQLRGRGDGN